MSEYLPLTKHEKNYKWVNRFGTLYKLFVKKLWMSLFREKKSWIFNILMILPILVGPIMVLVRTFEVEDFFSIYSDLMFMGYFGIIIPLFTMYVASMMFNDEITDKTITYLTIRPINRFEIVIIKYLSYLTIIPIFTVILTLLIYLSFGFLSGFQNLIQFFDLAWWFMACAIVTTAVYGAFFMLVGLLFKNPLWFGLFFVFIWEFVFASFSETLNNLTIAYYIKSLIVFDIYGSPFKDSPAIFFGNQAYQFFFYRFPTNAWTFSVVLIIVIILSITLSWAFLQGDRFVVPYHAGLRPGGWKYYLKEIRSYLITFGILFITLGTVFGPVAGFNKLDINGYYDEITVKQEPWDEFDIDNPKPPNLAQMDWGIAIPYSLSKGDSIDVNFTMVYASRENYQMYCMLMKKNVYDNLYLQTQELWLQYATDYYYEPSSVLYITLLNDYQNVVESNLVNVEVYDTLSSYYTVKGISYSTIETERIYIVLLVYWFQMDSYDRRFHGECAIDVYANVSRKAGYIFGWIIFSSGLITMGFAIYSIVRYSSEIEIKRYEEKIQKYQEIEKTQQNEEKK